MATVKTGDFAGVGGAEGLTIWRIEKLKPTLIHKETYGQFSEGDSYICLFSKKKGSAMSHDIHFWLGKDTTHDEAGIAAYKTVELDDGLGGSPVQHREVQEHESELFLSYFKNWGGVRYMKGGVESGFKHVEAEKYKPRLLHVKGKRNVRVLEIEAKTSAMNEGDVYVYDAGVTLYLYEGKESSQAERIKGVQVVAQIKNERSKAKPKDVIMRDEPAEGAEFWKALGPKSSIKPASAGGADDDFEKKAAPKLRRVSDASGTLSISEVALSDGKLKKDMLDSNDVFIVDGTSSIYVWVGKGASEEEKKNAMITGTKYLASSGLPNFTPIERVLEKAETTAFTQCFSGWRPEPKQVRPEDSASAGVLSPRSAAAVDIKALTKKKNESEKLIDDGSGNLTIWRIEDMEPVECPKDLYGNFYGGDSYIVKYTYKLNGKEAHIVYYWQGKESSKDEVGASALHATKIKDACGGSGATLCRVTQGKEPQHFCVLFKGGLVIHAGGKASGFKNRSDADSYDVDGVSLFHVKGSNPLNTKAVQVEEKASALNSGDCFVLQTPGVMFVWEGSRSSAEEKVTANKVAVVLQGKRSTVKIPEGKETDAFWAALGGKGEYNKATGEVPVDVEPRLYLCSTGKGGFRAEEVTNYGQEDLNSDDVMLLDTYNEIFAWIGSGSNKEEQKLAIEFAERYVHEVDDGRDVNSAILAVNEGFEPSIFTQHFVGWNPMLGCSGEASYKRKLAALSVAAGSPTGLLTKQASTITSKSLDFAVGAVHTYAELKGKGSIPAGVDPARKEEYLSDAEFLTVFGMDKATFKAQPAWKVKQTKQAKDLF